MSIKNENKYYSPEISQIPLTDPKRLIDCGMLHYEASVAGYNERYHKGETSHTIHVWWARRPHSAMRSLVFASLSKDLSDEATDVMAELAMGPNDEALEKAKNIISSGYDTPPRVLDMFGGGGTIPFEAKKLGADTYSIDANQLSVFIQTCNMIYANRIDLDKAKDLVGKSGQNILNRLKEDTDWLYPLRKTSNEKTFGYMWSYKTKCSECKKEFFLMKKPWLSTKKGKKISFQIKQGIKGDIIEITNNDGGAAFSPPWERGSGRCFCPYCNALQDKIDIFKCEDTMLAIINTEEKGKSFDYPPVSSIPSFKAIQTAERKLLNETGFSLPTSELPVWSGVVNPALYGIKTHADFLNPRQRLVLLYLLKELVTEYRSLQASDEIMAKFVIGVLSSLLDQVIDWNCRMSCWIQSNEQVGRAFCGPGVAMLWEYTETDMVLHGPANLWDKLKRIVNGISSFSNTNGNITVKHAHAQDLPFDNDFFDAIITDPPYYDNIYYSILADFFYSWKRILLKQIEPELFSKEITDMKYELVASSRREGKGSSPHESYCIELKQAFNEAARVIKNDGVFSFIYSHSSANGWDAVIQAYRSSPFRITSVQPLSIERKGRPRAVMSEAVNTCMTFVARKNYSERSPLDIEALRSQVNDISSTFGKQLTSESGWCEADAGLAILACAVGIIANSSEIEGVESDIDALVVIGKDIKSIFPEFNLKVRASI